MQGSIQTLALALALQKGSLAAGARKETEDPNHTGVVWFKKLTLTTAHTRVCAHALALTHARTQNHTHSHTHKCKKKKRKIKVAHWTCHRHICMHFIEEKTFC